MTAEFTIFYLKYWSLNGHVQLEVVAQDHRATQQLDLSRNPKRHIAIIYQFSLSLGGINLREFLTIFH